MRWCCALALLCGSWTLVHSVSAQSRVHPLVDLRSIDSSPFPSDYFTVADARHHTGRRINLALPDCHVRVSDCADIAVLNQLDGFSMEPRIWVPFDGDIDPASVSSTSMFLVQLPELQSAGAAPSVAIGINQMVWDGASRVLSVRSDSALNQQSRYAFVVTTAVRDRAGRPIGRAEVTGADEAYRRALASAEPVVRRLLPAATEIAALTVFTTQSFSHVIERIRDAVQRAPAPTLDFAVGPDGTRAMFALPEIRSITNNIDYGLKAPANAPPFGPLPALRVVPGVGTVAFGKFTALDFTTRGSGHIAPIPTRTGTLPVTGSVTVAFNLVVPSGAPPAAGWPIVMCGHGSNVAKNYCLAASAVPASHGFAVIALNAMSHGGGAKTTMTVTRNDGTSMTFAAPGNGYDQNGDGSIDLFEPRGAAEPYAIMEGSGPILQTAAFYLQLVRAIQQGVDVDGDGRRDLDPSHIYYFGQSLGGMYGMYAFAYEPAIRAAVFVVPAGENTDNRRLSPGYRQIMAQRLAARTPSLINGAAGVTAIDGVATPPPHFNENLPLRNQPTLINDVPGAIAIQRFADRTRWAYQTASTVAIAPFLRRTPAPGVRPRPVLIQFARSDPASTNPSTSEMIRAGDLADRTAFYRHDRNFGNEGVPANSHLFLGAITAPPSYSRIARGAQEQIAEFFKSDGVRLTHPAPAELWEVPIEGPLPEDLLLLPRPK